MTTDAEIVAKAEELKAGESVSALDVAAKLKCHPADVYVALCSDSRWMLLGDYRWALTEERARA